MLRVKGVGVANTRVAEIDLFRFLAAIAVVIFHYAFRGFAADDLSIMPYPLLSDIARYGYLGVDLFFIISGFVIFMTASSGSAKRFFISRVVRLYPAFWVCCTVTFLVTLAIGEHRFSASFGQYLANMTMMGEFFNVPSIDGVYWTLYIEIKLYALVMLLLLFGLLHRLEILLVAWLMVTVILDLFPAYALQSLLITHYAPYFVAGATFFLVYSKGLSVLRLAIIVASWAVSIKHALSLIPDYEQRFGIAFNSVVIGCVISLFFIALFLVVTKKMKWLSSIDWTLFGSLTYPLYLLHENIGFMVFNLAYPRFNQHIIFWGTLGIMLLAAYCVNLFIEKKYASIFKIYLNNLCDAFLSWIFRRVGIRIERDSN